MSAEQAAAAWLLEPKSPLVLRTGRPFDQAGDPVCLDFPLPSTIAGACRTALADAMGLEFSAADVDALRAMAVHGPLAASVEGDSVRPLFPRPADSLFLDQTSDGPRVHRLRPGRMDDDAWSDLPAGLEPVFLASGQRGKPSGGASWWSMDHVVRWLLEEEVGDIRPAELGWMGPTRELRTHVQLASQTLAAEAGQLFQTEGLCFAPAWGADGAKASPQHGLLARLDQQLPDGVGMARLGGEGRIASLRCLEDGWPQIDGQLLRRLQDSPCIRLILATPALFSHGWRPAWLQDELTGSPPGLPEMTLRLRAFAAPRWQPLSGWDLCSRKARAVRRLMPAGSVYWFEVEKGLEHAGRLWLRPVSDLEQDRRDGYGLVLPGIWKN